MFMSIILLKMSINLKNGFIEIDRTTEVKKAWRKNFRFQPVDKPPIYSTIN